MAGIINVNHKSTNVLWEGNKKEILINGNFYIHLRPLVSLIGNDYFWK